MPPILRYTVILSNCHYRLLAEDVKIQSSGRILRSTTECGLSTRNSMTLYGHPNGKVPEENKGDKEAT